MIVVTAASIFVSVLFLVAGTLLLYLGAEGLVRGSSSLAVRMKITPLVIGLTIVAFGTSSPELVVGITASIKGRGAIAVGTVIGANICNIALILGLSALIRPVTVNLRYLRPDLAVLFLSSVALTAMFYPSGTISVIEGAILALGVIAYTISTIYFARRMGYTYTVEKKPGIVEKITTRSRFDFLLIAVGVAILVLGADLFIEGAIAVAARLGIDDAKLGLSIVALGTSLPELATSLVAIYKKEYEISVGNLIGSCIFNVLCITGFASMINPVSTMGIGLADILIFMILPLLFYMFIIRTQRINRVKGIILISIYICYMIYLYLQI